MKNNFIAAAVVAIFSTVGAANAAIQAYAPNTLSYVYDSPQGLKAMMALLQVAGGTKSFADFQAEYPGHLDHYDSSCTGSSCANLAISPSVFGINDHSGLDAPILTLPDGTIITSQAAIDDGITVYDTMQNVAIQDNASDIYALGIQNDQQQSAISDLRSGVGDLSDRVGDMSKIKDTRMKEFQNVDNLVDAIVHLDGLLHRDSADGTIHLGGNSFVFDDSEPDNHTIGTSSGSPINMVSSQANNNSFALAPSAADFSGLKVNGDYIATQDWVRDGFAQLGGGLNSRIDDLSAEMRAGFAGAAAMSSLIPNARAKGNTQVSFGVGTYRDQYGIAAGAFHYVNNNVLLNAGASYSRDNFTGRAGITIGW